MHGFWAGVVAAISGEILIVLIAIGAICWMEFIITKEYREHNRIQGG